MLCISPLKIQTYLSCQLLIAFPQVFFRMVQCLIYKQAQKEFTKSNEFTASSKFTKSDEFTKSNEFTSSNKFSNSKEFAKSNDFSESNKFTKSTQFTKSNDFTESDKFSESNKFTKSNNFTESNDFTKSKDFTYSNEFTHLNKFTKSNDFTNSDHFSKSEDFSYSEYFTKSVAFTRSDINPHIYIGEGDKKTETKSNNAKRMALYFGVPVASAAAVGASIAASIILTRNRGLPSGAQHEAVAPTAANNNGTNMQTENPVFGRMDADDPFENDFEERLQSIP